MPRHRPFIGRGNPHPATASSRRLRAGGLTLLGLLVAACGGESSDGGATTTSPAPTGTASATSTMATAVGASTSIDAASALDQLNAARAVERTCGTSQMPAVPPLRWSAALEQAATGHSEWMQANDVFDHIGDGGSDVGMRATAAGYAWKMVGENIAAGHPDVPSVVRAWLESPGHCMNIMHPDFVDVALAMKPGTSSNTYRTWWTLDFGRPR